MLIQHSKGIYKYKHVCSMPLVQYFYLHVFAKEMQGITEKLIHHVFTWSTSQSHKTERLHTFQMTIKRSKTLPLTSTVQSFPNYVLYKPLKTPWGSANLETFKKPLHPAAGSVAPPAGDIEGLPHCVCEDSSKNKQHHTQWNIHELFYYWKLQQEGDKREKRWISW